MLCPFCKHSCIDGYIITQGIEWNPTNEPLKLIYNEKQKEKGFRLGKIALFNKKKQPTDYCPKCDYLFICCNE